jgi:hypothetical protein
LAELQVQLAVHGENVLPVERYWLNCKSACGSRRECAAG